MSIDLYKNKYINCLNKIELSLKSLNIKNFTYIFKNKINNEFYKRLEIYINSNNVIEYWIEYCTEHFLY